ncbi:MAG TPA: Rrf2 family transcriptional regulator [Candidatus Marinimicrobia bacterium]|jgi:Rrf2 family protein|nr:Rrf2 family transcriptional regulator [Candidatus Neomarinimicrobiota bacterium]HJM70402.1 Rrf2 family transcriptional regulator [Candidatus Neomarinimicrobiota bacterium]|tara:strand:+ start:1164 stop:1628 length:465 start_codon:yes stop_codon:yes gene_type:complete
MVVKSNFMLYSKSAEYAIQAMIYLAEHKPEKPVMIRKIAEDYNIPYQFLAKIMQVLVKHRLIKAMRGRTGGVLLAKDSSKIYLNQIVNAIDGPPPEEDMCVVGLDLCTDEAPCPLHDRYKPIRKQLSKLLVEESLEDLSKNVIQKRKKMALLRK